MPKAQRILAVDPGTREMGVAVLENRGLVYQGVESFPRFNSAEECLEAGRKTVCRLIRDFRPTVLAVERTFIGKNPNTALLNEFAHEICSIGQGHGITVVSLAANTVKKVVAGDGRASKADVARAVAVHFPVLRAFLPPDRKWKRLRQLNMFDAVALALACSNEWRPGTRHTP